MDKFYCKKCDKIFKAKGKKKTWKDPIFGPCYKIVAKCPKCKKECEEYRPKSANKTCNCTSCSGCF